MRPVALLTDFGTHDIYVGVMKGVMRGICPQSQFIDITHGVRPQSVRDGALALRNSFRYFAAGTIFLVVIDPGVGSTRRPIVVKGGGYWFVAPDNGVLSYALAQIGSYQAVLLENPRYRLNDISQTFHGRDIFAPAAAYLARGDIDFSAFGPTLPEIFTLPLPQLQVDEKQISGEITHIDHFGNLLTSVGVLRRIDDQRLLLEPLNGQPGRRILAEKATITLAGRTVQGIRRAYHECLRGELLAQIDSNGYLEIAINQGSAAHSLGVAVGDLVQLTISED
ncbi:MAG: SAM-dependent chlorinase/fluorinase [Anaerolineae bacterium]|jgi:hypothetical protein|nr:SAM-dependent chlorinase/fluorinase [Anaerolineae bacterium]